MGKDGDKNEMRYYNGHTEQEIGGAYGLAKIGIENCKPFFTRGHLFDVEAREAPTWMSARRSWSPTCASALQKQNMQEADIKEGDAVFFNTGWGKLWLKNNDKFNSGEPGIGLEVAKWCVDKGVCLTGADQWATEVVPNPNKDLAFPVHGELICKNGIYNHENLDFTGLIADRKYQFALHLLAGADQRRDRIEWRADRSDLRHLTTHEAERRCATAGAFFLSI